MHIYIYIYIHTHIIYTYIHTHTLVCVVWEWLYSCLVSEVNLEPKSHFPGIALSALPYSKTWSSGDPWREPKETRWYFYIVGIHMHTFMSLE